MLTKCNVPIGTFLALLPLASAGAGEHANVPRWTLSQQITPKELADGESLLFQGTSPAPFCTPGPESFRLERLNPKPVWVVMTFGWPDKGHIEFDYFKDAKTGKVNLRLRRSDRGQDRLQMMQQVLDRRDPPPVDLHAECALQEGVRYRLSWSFRLAGSDTVQTKQCEFQIGEASANHRPAIGATKEISKQPYLVEILFRDDDGVLFLAQTVLPEPEDHDFTIAAVGFTSHGKHVPPPDPGYVTKQVNLTQLPTKSATPKPQPAERTRLFGASLARACTPPGQVAVSISDMGTTGPLPKAPGEPTFIAFSSGLHDAVFRVELLTANVEILRRDRDYWQKRTRAITAELLKRRTWIKEDARRLAAAACVLRDTRVTDDLRNKLQAWIDRGKDEIKQTRFPHHLVDAIVVVGDAKDVHLLGQIAERPGQASFLVWKVAPLARRIGVGPTRNLLLTLLDVGQPLGPHDGLKRLREQDQGVPEPVHGDGMLLEIVRSFELDPSEFNLVMVEQRLLEMADRYPLSARDQDRCETCVKFKSGTWIMPSLEARKRGHEAMRRWIERNVADREGAPRPASDEGKVEAPRQPTSTKSAFDGHSGNSAKCEVLRRAINAADRGDVAALRPLLDKQPQLTEATDRFGNGLLHAAARAGRKEALELLLDKGANVNGRNDRGETPLLLVVQYSGGLALARSLIARGASATIAAHDKGPPVGPWDERRGKDKGWTPLHFAANRGSAELVRLLLTHGAVVDASDLQEYTPLHLAARGGHKKAADLLITADADVKSQTVSGGTPLHYAAYGGSADLVKCLLAKGAPVNAREHNGMTPLHWAARCGHAESVSLLLTSGAEIDAPGEVGWTALHEAAINSRNQVLNVLLEKKAVIGTKDDGGMTALHWAADRGKPEIVRPLLAAGADPNVKNRTGQTPLSIAAEKGHCEAASLLKGHTAKHQ
jgi:cytohesin